MFAALLMLVSFLIVIGTFLATLFSRSGHPFDFSPLQVAGVFGVISLFLIAGKPNGPCLHCSLPDPTESYCPDCGRHLHRPPNPFRLAILLFGTAGAVLLAFLGVCLGLWLWLAVNLESQEKLMQCALCLGCFLLSFLCARAVRGVSR